ncbi:SusE domain-containing protein [Parasediminibacterium sp. JCM 36343]|uniref:SusE domain-containing protein n=1 Tax=Parasediminibacterium sp. JCM 36343 TaxID=3374279 RepID=UPI00397DF22D
MKKIFIAFIAMAATFAACKKADLATNTPTGEGLVGFNLKTPTSGTSLLLNASTPSATVDITWGASTPGLKTLPTYKWLLALKSVGDFSNPVLSVPANNGGVDTKLTLTYKQIDDSLNAKGIKANASTDYIWTVQADNGSTQLLANNVFNLSITRFGNATSPFVILGPVSTVTPIAIDPGSTTNNIVFNWTKSIPAVGSPAVKYQVLFAERKLDANGNEIPVDWTKPLFTVASNTAGTDTLASIAYKTISDSLVGKGFTNLSAPTLLKWTVVATSGTWKQQSTYENIVGILREVRVYMPGGYQTATGNGTDWTPANAPELIRDTRDGLTNNLYYTYIYLPAGTEFKLTQGRGWDIAFGGVSPITFNGSSVTGDATSNNGSNLKVTAAGVYRISFNRTTLKINISLGRMGFVGAAVNGVGWVPGNVFPAGAMGNIGTNLFLGIHDFTADGWKIIDNDQWDNGSKTVDETRSYGSTGPSGSALVTNADNMPNIPAAGRYRVIWDGTDVNNVKYTLNEGNMYVIGAATVGGWDNSATQTDAQRPPLTYMGNGKWQGVVALTAGEFKFIIKKGSWDFSYGGTGGKLSYNNGANLSVATAGNYTITVDEYAQTYSVQ